MCWLSIVPFVLTGPFVRIKTEKKKKISNFRPVYVDETEHHFIINWIITVDWLKSQWIKKQYCAGLQFLDVCQVFQQRHTHSAMQRGLLPTNAHLKQFLHISRIRDDVFLSRQFPHRQMFQKCSCTRTPVGGQNKTNVRLVYKIF